MTHHREAHTLVPRQLAVPNAERIARKKRRRRRRWERQQRAAPQQPIRFLEGYTALPSPQAMLAPSFASKTGTESYDDEEDYILDEESSSGNFPAFIPRLPALLLGLFSCRIGEYSSFR